MSTPNPSTDRSTNTGGDCVEVTPWQKSSRSGPTGGDCVEVAVLPAWIG